MQATGVKWLEVDDCEPSLIHALNQQMLLQGNKKLHPLVVKHLAAMGMTSPEQVIAFLSPSRDHCHSPWLMKGMQELVEQLEDAIVTGKAITVVGDYDVDGVCATAIAYLTLKELGAHVDYYIPHRVQEGYGIKSTVVERLKARGTEVILTVDNGIASLSAIELAKSYGITTLVTDHHQPGDELPCADVIVNPHQKGCRYPFKEICGGAIAYKMAQALFEHFGRNSEDVTRFDEHLALCTVADVMPLRDENRFFVVNGLEKMRKNPSAPFKALFKVQKKDHRQADETTLGFYFGPMINAPGRLDSAEIPLKLLTSETPLEAAILANTCQEYNIRRQDLVAEAYKTATEHVVPTDPVQVICFPMHEGIAGIVAGNIKEEMFAPTFVLTPAHNDKGEEILKGSARSVPGFSVYKCLKAVWEQHPSWFHSFGGHAGAAGVSLHVGHLEDFREAVNEYFRQNPAGEPTVYYLAQIEEEECMKVARALECLAPYGQGNPRPLFLLKSHLKDKQIFGPKANHLRIETDQGSSLTYFRKADAPIQLGQPADVCVQVGISVWMGRPRLDLLVEHIAQ